MRYLVVNPRKIIFIVSGFPATGVWFAWYYEQWPLMISCLVLAVPIMLINAYITKSVKARLLEISIIMAFYLPIAFYSFAKLYQSRGLVINNEVVHSFNSSLYFSIVTWTTLGYGDFHPTQLDRLWAATEAMFGYIFMAVLIAACFSLFQCDRKNS